MFDIFKTHKLSLINTNSEDKDNTLNIESFMRDIDDSKQKISDEEEHDISDQGNDSQENNVNNHLTQIDPKDVLE